MKTKAKIILASQSPRRQQLLKDLGLNFEIRVADIEENYPKELEREAIVEFLAELKSNAIECSKNEVLITSDTIVWINDHILEKPKNASHSKEMILELSGVTHEVLSGVCISYQGKKHTFHSVTKVHFKTLSDSEVDYYVSNYKPFDKAGSYGIQEWIGYAGIKGIEGDYFNVMGLPVNMVYDKLKELGVISPN